MNPTKECKYRVFRDLCFNMDVDDWIIISKIIIYDDECVYTNCDYCIHRHIRKLTNHYEENFILDRAI